MSSQNLTSLKRAVLSHWEAVDVGLFEPRIGVSPQLRSWLHEPLGGNLSWEETIAALWRPLTESFGPLHRELHLFFGGISNGRRDGDLSQDGALWVTGSGLMHGTFRRDYLGIQATQRPIQMRWGEFLKFEDGMLREIYLMHDLVDFCEQIRRPILPSPLGRAAIYPRPALADGVLLDHSDATTSSHSLNHIRDFLFNGLNAYDQSSLKSMGMERYFHPDIAWYGPGGIGACFGLNAFQSNHQAHWLRAFPDRQVQDLTGLFAEGSYSGGPGWGAVKATHHGPYLGVSASGVNLSINGLDWWKRDGDQYVENWVFVDMVHLFGQMGLDILARART